jgi:hypothetical protein
MKNVFLIVALAISISGLAQNTYQLKIKSYTLYKARGYKQPAEVIANSFDTIYEQLNQLKNVVSFHNEYKTGYLIGYNDDAFGYQRCIKNYIQLGNTINFEFNGYDYDVNGMYVPMYDVTCKFSITNKFAPTDYMYDSVHDITMLCIYECESVTKLSE